MKFQKFTTITRRCKRFVSVAKMVILYWDDYFIDLHFLEHYFCLEEYKNCPVPFRSKGFHTAVGLNFHVMIFKNGLHSARLSLGTRIDNTHFWAQNQRYSTLPCGRIAFVSYICTRVKGNRRNTWFERYAWTLLYTK